LPAAGPAGGGAEAGAGGNACGGGGEEGKFMGHKLEKLQLPEFFCLILRFQKTFINLKLK
jgi:hypothetical protein